MFFEGYGKFFGIEAYAYINITMQGMEIYIWGKAWDLIYAELYISAGYDVTNIRNAHFYVRVIIDLRGLTQVRWHLIGEIRFFDTFFCNYFEH